MHFRLRFRSGAEELRRVRALVRSLLETEPGGVFGPEDTQEILLGLQEALTNSARHAYGVGREGPVELTCRIENGQFRATIRDRGRAFDPAAVQEPDPAQPAAHGFGIFLIRRIMDQVTWSRKGVVNLVHLKRGRRGGEENAGPGLKQERGLAR